MILHLGDDVSVHIRDIIAIIDLTQSQSAMTGAMLSEIRRQNRILAKQGITAKSAVICAGARKPGGMTENPRVYLSPISTTTLAQRAHERAYPMDAAITAQNRVEFSTAQQEEE
jgi:hypothetical protein